MSAVQAFNQRQTLHELVRNLYELHSPAHCTQRISEEYLYSKIEWDSHHGFSPFDAMRYNPGAARLNPIKLLEEDANVNERYLKAEGRYSLYKAAETDTSSC